MSSKKREVSRKRLGNGMVRYSYPGGFHDVSETRFSEMELKLIDNSTTKTKGEVNGDGVSPALASFIHRYEGKRYDRDDPEIKLLNKGKRGGR